MNLPFAKRLFQKSDGLFRGKNYAAALILLDRLDAAFPDTRRIMYPRAMCLAEAGRTEEAIAVCDRLIARHKFMRAADLKPEHRSPNLNNFTLARGQAHSQPRGRRWWRGGVPGARGGAPLSFCS
jgi:hypothetical protein